MPPRVFTSALKVRIKVWLEIWNFGECSAWWELCWNAEEWRTAGESFVGCLHYSVFHLLHEGGSVLWEMVWIKRSVSTSFPLEVWGTCWSGADWDPWFLVLLAFQVWVQETRSNILNAGTLLLCMLCAKLCLDALAYSQGFNLFFFVSAWIVYIIL